MTQRKLALMDTPCLFCGEDIEGELNYSERSTTYDCMCDEAVLKRDLLEEIESLRRRIPSEHGLYCETNFHSIEFGYKMGIALYNMLSKHEGVEELYDKIYKEVYDED